MIRDCHGELRIIPFIRRICITILGLYLIFLQTYLEPWLNIITISLFGIYIMWETLHTEKIWNSERKLRLREAELKWEKEKIMYKIVDKL